MQQLSTQLCITYEPCPERKFRDIQCSDAIKILEYSISTRDCITVDRETFARKNIRLKFSRVLFSSPRNTGSVASFLLFHAEKYKIFVVVGYRRNFFNNENFLIYGNLLGSSEGQRFERSNAIK